MLQKHGVAKTRFILNRDILQNKKESLKLLVPALLYTVQNNLLFVAISNLDPAVYSVTYQIKVITTAFFAVVILGQRLSPKQWGSLVLLMVSEKQ